MCYTTEADLELTGRSDSNTFRFNINKLSRKLSTPYVVVFLITVPMLSRGHQPLVRGSKMNSKVDQGHLGGAVS